MSDDTLLVREAVETVVSKQPTINLDKPNESEPVLLRMAITVVVGDVLSLAAAFGLDLSDRTKAVIFISATLVLPAVAILWARRKTWSPASVIDVLEETIHEYAKIKSEQKREQLLESTKDKLRREFPEKYYQERGHDVSY